MYPPILRVQIQERSAEDFMRSVFNDIKEIFFDFLLPKHMFFGTHLDCLALSRQFI